MNSSVTRLREISVMSSSCLVISDRSRSNGPSKSPSETRKPTDSSAPAAPSGFAVSGDGATEHQFPRQLTVRLRGLVLRRELRDRGGRDGRIGELHGPRDDRLEHPVAEGVDDA